MEYLPTHLIRKKKNNNDVKNFCKVNFSINFPLSVITDVKGDNAHEIFKWAKENHGKSAIPKWNFHKILINKSGKVEETYSSFTKPSKRINISSAVIPRLIYLLKKVKYV